MRTRLVVAASTAATTTIHLAAFAFCGFASVFLNIFAIIPRTSEAGTTAFIIRLRRPGIIKANDDSAIMSRPTSPRSPFAARLSGLSPCVSRSGLARKPFTKDVRVYLPGERSGHEGVHDAVQPAWNDSGAVFEQTAEALRYALLDAHWFHRHGLRIEAELFEHLFLPFGLAVSGHAFLECRAELMSTRHIKEQGEPIHCLIKIEIGAGHGRSPELLKQEARDLVLFSVNPGPHRRISHSSICEVDGKRLRTLGPATDFNRVGNVEIYFYSS